MSPEYLFMVYYLVTRFVKKQNKRKALVNTRNSSSRAYESTTRLPWTAERQARHFTGTVFASVVWLGQGSGPRPSALEADPYHYVTEAVKFIPLHVTSLSCHLQLRRVQIKNKCRVQIKKQVTKTFACTKKQRIRIHVADTRISFSWYHLK